MGKYLEALERGNQDPIQTEIENRRQKILYDMNSSRRITYRQLNSSLESPTVYNKQISVPEHHRIAFTRVRVGSHRFRIETGRWSRIPRERRLCPCGQIQDEVHVLKDCILLSDIRENYTDINYDDLSVIINCEDIVYLSKYIYNITRRIKELNENE